MRCPSCFHELSDDSRSGPACGSLLPESIAATMATGGLRRSTWSSQTLGRFAPGTMIAERYRIIGMLGKGGMGEVYRAEDLTLDQAVALKFLPEKVAADPERLGRFYNEVRVAR